MKSQTKQGKKMRVLVVDDESSVLVTYKLILEQQGYEVVAAATSKQAIDALQEQDFDLVLCDFSLEQQHSGFEVIDVARKKDAKVPCVLLTGYATLETADQAKQNGIEVLFKPIDIAEFLNTTAVLLRSKE
ncbi:MAG TPA: response regulator [Terriglobales bacterium]|nr:response regulator [Terriglobales bacterium]